MSRQNPPGTFTLTKYSNKYASMCQFHGAYIGNVEDLFCIRTSCYPAMMIIVCAKCLESIGDKMNALKTGGA